jgi:hypothetical protein
MAQRDLIARLHDLHFIDPSPIDEDSVRAAEVLQRHLALVDHKAGMPPRDEWVVQNQLAAVAAAHDGHPGAQLEVALVLKA